MTNDGPRTNNRPYWRLTNTLQLELLIRASPPCAYLFVLKFHGWGVAFWGSGSRWNHLSLWGLTVFLPSRIFWRFNRANGLYFLTSMPIGKCFALNNIYLCHHTKHRRMKNVRLISGVGLIRVAARFGHWEEENRSSQNIFIIFWWILKFQSESTFCCEYILVQNARKSFLDKTPSSPNQTAKCQAVPNQSRKTQEEVSSRHGAERSTVPHRRAGASFNLERFARPDDALEEAGRRRPRFLRCSYLHFPARVLTLWLPPGAQSIMMLRAIVHKTYAEHHLSSACTMFTSCGVPWFRWLGWWWWWCRDDDCSKTKPDMPSPHPADWLLFLPQQVVPPNLFPLCLLMMLTTCGIRYRRHTRRGAEDQPRVL